MGIALSVYLFREPLIAFLYVLLPLAAATTINWLGGLGAQALVMMLVALLYRYPPAPGMPATLGAAVFFGAALAGLLGWATTRSLLTVTQWSLSSFEQARARVEEARDQRQELKQIQDDLILANRELSRLSDRLKAMQHAAEEARRAKEEFVANVSHELRTPLNMIIGFSEMIPRLSQVYGTKLPPPLLSDIAAIQRNAHHLAKLVDDVLDLSQVDAGRMALSKEWASLADILGEAVQVVQPLFRSKGLSLQVDAPHDLPPLFCDATRIRQVVINLLSNAGRFTERGGVEVRARSDRREVIVSVADTGPGIPPEQQDRLFQPFQQLDSSIRRRHGGSGLGLSIGKRFVEMHGGRMWLKSEVGKGTTFYFSLPVDAPASASEVGNDPRRWFNPYQQYEPRTRRSKAPVAEVLPRIVVVETGNSLLRQLRRHMADVEVTAVRDIAEAGTELARSPAQALVINAPTCLEGPLPSRMLADVPYATPVFTCWIPGQDEAAQRLGAVRYLLKPISREALLATLNDLGESVRTVLLVDDEPEVLRLFTRILSTAERPYHILQATDGERALSLLRQRRPDVMLLDLIMPGMDGLQVLQEKSQDPELRAVPVVVVSSRDPSGEPLVSQALTVTRGGGLSVRDLLSSIRAVSEVLNPAGPRGGRGRPETPLG